MPGSMSNQGRAAAFRQHTDAEFVVLLTFDHPSIIGGPVRVCSGGRQITSRGAVYEYFPFSVEFPGDKPDAPPQARLRIDNVDRRFVEAIRSLSGDLSVTIEVVLRSQPSVLEEGPIHLVLRDVEYDEVVISGLLLPEPLLGEPCPADKFTPSRNPGLFRGTIGVEQ